MRATGQAGVMRHLIGAGTPRQAAAEGSGAIFLLITPTSPLLIALPASGRSQATFAVAFLNCQRELKKSASSLGCDPTQHG